MADDQYVEMADGKLVLIEQKSCPVRTALHTMWGSMEMDPVSYAVLPSEEDVVILGSPALAALEIYMSDSASVISPSRVWNRQTSMNVGG